MTDVVQVYNPKMRKWQIVSLETGLIIHTHYQRTKKFYGIETYDEREKKVKK